VAVTGLFGPYSLDEETVNRIVKGLSPGTYALGYLNQNEAFVVKYVGRSDDDLNGRLKKHVGEGYLLFKYAFYSSVKSAYEKECYLWHDFGGEKGELDNKYHPDKGDHKDWECPVCGE